MKDTKKTLIITKLEHQNPLIVVLLMALMVWLLQWFCTFYALISFWKRPSNGFSPVFKNEFAQQFFTRNQPYFSDMGHRISVVMMLLIAVLLCTCVYFIFRKREAKKLAISEKGVVLYQSNVFTPWNEIKDIAVISKEYLQESKKINDPYSSIAQNLEYQENGVIRYFFCLNGQEIDIEGWSISPEKLADIVTEYRT